MEVYLCKTPEVSHETMTEVLEILNNGSKSLKFEFLPMQYNYEELPFLRKFRMNFNFSNESLWLKDKYIKELGPPLSWSEIFRTCNAVREKHQLEHEAL